MRVRIGQGWEVLFLYTLPVFSYTLLWRLTWQGGPRRDPGDPGHGVGTRGRDRQRGAGR